MLRLTLALTSLLVSGCQTPEAAQAPSTGGSQLAEVPAGAPTSGRWVGDLERPGGAARIPASLSLARIGSGSYRAVLKLSPGGEASHEYASLYFQDVRFDAASQRLAFAGGPDGVQLADVVLSPGTLAATLTIPGHAPARLAFTLEGESGAAPNPFAGLPVVHQVTGRYAGTCPGGITGLDVEASRWPASGDDALFGSYRVTARTVTADERRCGKGQSCVKESFALGALDLVTGELTLRVAAAAKDGLTCQEKGDSLVCGPCTLTKDPATAHAVVDGTRAAKRQPRSEHLAAPDDAASPLGNGQYYGYLHHEARGLYQLVALNLKDHAGVATLYFGEGDSSEFIAFKLARDAATPLVLDGSGDAFLVVDSWQGPTLTGTWYSKSFGRVGTVELQKDLVPHLADGVPTVGPLSGLYQGDAWRLQLTAQPGVSEAVGDQDPLKVYGWAQERIAHARRRTVDGASFDFYTGVLAFHMDDGRIALGQVAPDELQLHWPPKGRPGTPLLPDRTDVFHRVGDRLEALAP